MGPTTIRRLCFGGLGVVALAILAVSPVSASNVVTGLTESSGDVTVPTWLYLATGGGVVGAMALLSMLVTDTDVIDGYHNGTQSFSTHILRQLAIVLFSLIGIAGLSLLVIVGIYGPQLGQVSATVLVTFVGVRALLTMITYTIGNPWPLLNPWRTIARTLPHGYRAYPSWLGTWPAVGVLLILIWIEIIAPLSSNPSLLASLIVVYSITTIAGAVIFSPTAWFHNADPISVWFRFYGSVAPIQRTDAGIECRFPGAKLSDGDLLRDISGVAFIIVLVWELTYTGFIVTPVGHWTIETLVGIGFNPALVYLGLLLVGFAVCCWIYWIASGLTRHMASTYLSQQYLAIRFAPPLLAIAAGYHFAHYAGFVISLWPSFVDSLASPLAPPTNPTIYALTPWFGYVEIFGILFGHIIGVWIAHTIAFQLFDGKIQAVKSEFPYVALMIGFTMVSLWLVSLPTESAPFT